VITHEGNREWVERMAARPHTRQPDALAKSPKSVVIETVGAEREFKDQAMALTLIHLDGNPHSDTLLMAYVPSARVVIEVDTFFSGNPYNPYAANLLQNIQSRKLAVDRIVPLHGAISPMADLLKAVQ
jgi:glyoxylase-like metal-dependent hydrolase (beta-lactamase superfamily II)